MNASSSVARNRRSKFEPPGVLEVGPLLLLLLLGAPAASGAAEAMKRRNSDNANTQGAMVCVWHLKRCC
jgi:hypothetical protein